jgi:hypothetical protein
MKPMNPHVKLSLISNVWIKLMTFANAGDFNPGHRHVFDHPTLLTQGSVEVEVEGRKSTFVAPHIIYIKKGLEHTITALEPNTVCACIHAIRDGDGVDDIIDPDSIPDGVNPNHMDNIPGIRPLATG